MDHTKDKFKYGVESCIRLGKDQLNEAYNKINLIERISKVQDEMSKNSKISSMEEYVSIYINDEVYLNLIKERERYTDIRADILTKISSCEDISQDEINTKLDYIKSELDPRIEDCDRKLDDRREKINLHREEYEKNSDNRKTIAKKVMLGVALAGSGVILVANPKTRKIAVKGGKALIAGAIKGGTKLL